RSGRTLSGQTIDAFWVSVAHARPFSVGLNCALGARDMRPYLAELARIAECYVSCYPNAGLPNAFGQYDEKPDETGGYLHEFAANGTPTGAPDANGTPDEAPDENGTPKGAPYENATPKGAPYENATPEGAPYENATPKGAPYENATPEGAPYENAP